jgi:hypothetical protein
MYNNVRAIFNESLMIVILCIYGYYRAVVTEYEQLNSINCILPYVVIGLLLLCIIINIGLMIKYRYDVCKLKK